MEHTGPTGLESFLFLVEENVELQIKYLLGNRVAASSDSPHPW